MTSWSSSKQALRQDARRDGFAGFGELAFACVFQSFLISALDALLRNGARFSWGDHLVGTLALDLSLGGALALALFAATRLERYMFSLAGQQQRARQLRPWLRGLVTSGLCIPAARYAFSGARISESHLAVAGPPLFALFLGLLAAVLSVAWDRAERLRDDGRKGASFRLCALCLVGSAGLFWVDLNVYSYLYGPLHSVLEVSARALLICATLIWTRSVTHQRKLRFMRVSGAIASASAMAYLAPLGLRATTDELLSHVWLQELYVGRNVRRVQELQASLAGFETLDDARRAQLIERFALADTSLDPSWLAHRQLPTFPDLEGVKNIAVFYVDTLREDITRDAKLMPHLTRFRSQSLDFAQAYAVGSDTLRSLPALTSGNQFIQHRSPDDLLELSHRAGMHSLLIGARSAVQFLERLHPDFSFAQVVRIDDTTSPKNVWGYGADRPTAKRVVDAATLALARLDPNDAFFLWMLHFDQHAWRELDLPGLRRAQHAKPNASPREAGLARYRAVAASIDAQFGRFLQALEASGRADSTAVLFVSDHGEGLGQEGFWVHSVFLWDSLIHVPLVLRVPGVAARKITTPVSLVDVAPTLAPVMGQMEGLYHGESLLSLADPTRAQRFARRFPIVLRSASSNRLSRLGVIDPQTNRKLVLRVQALFPELYSLSTDLKDEHNLASEETSRVRRLLRLIARSPVFPRSQADFVLLGNRGVLPQSQKQARLEPPAISNDQTAPSPHTSPRGRSAAPSQVPIYGTQ